MEGAASHYLAIVMLSEARPPWRSNAFEDPASGARLARVKKKAPHAAGLIQKLTCLAPAAELREQPQQFEVQPDQRDHQCKAAVPLHVLGSVEACALLNQVEIEYQVH